MEFILKSALLIGILYSFYKIFLQKETFFKSIRLYFIIGLVVAIVIPLVIIPIYIEVSTTVSYIPEITESIYDLELPTLITSEIIKEETPFNWFGLLNVLYIVGVLFFSIKFIIEILSLYYLVYKSEKLKSGEITFVETLKSIAPFSIFNYIVYNKNTFSTTELVQIIAHEKVHVKQLHSYDMLLVHVLVIVQWFNPFAWLYKKDLQQNLEFLADKYAQKTSPDIFQNKENLKEYQYLLLKASIQKNPFALSTNFYNSLIKKRIIMLQKAPSKKLNQLKYVFVIPLLALFLYAFNTKEIVKPVGENLMFSKKMKLIVIDAGHGGKDPGTKIEDDLEKDIVFAIAKKIKSLYKGDVNLVFTREKDEYVTLSNRINKINELNPDLLISLHVNAAKDSNSNGITAYVSKKNSDINESKLIAENLLNNIANKDLKLNGIVNGNLKIISEVNNPAVLLELGYLTNISDKNYINSKKGQTEIANSIIDFINNKKTKSKKNTSVNKINFVNPIYKENVTKVSSVFGKRKNLITKDVKFHNGIDIVAHKGTDVYATANGIVIKATYNKLKGNYIQIKHADNYQTNYHHLGEIQITLGEQVKAGDIISTVGNSGKSTGPHLHYEVIKEGKNIDPQQFLNYPFKNKNTSISKNRELTGFNIVIQSKTTDKELLNIKKEFKTKNKVTLKIYDVKRNAKNQIIAIKIDGKTKNSSSSYSFSQDKPVPNILLGYDTKNDEIIIKNVNFINVDKRKTYSLSTSHHSNTDEHKELFLKRKTIKGLMIKSNFTNNEITKLVKDFENKFKVNLKIYDIKRNNKNEIIALKINANSKNTTNNFNFNDENSFYSITATYLKDKDKFYISSWANDTKKYIVKAKDTYYSIAKKHEISLEKLKELNPKVVFKIGAKLIIKKDSRHKNKPTSTNTTRLVEILNDKNKIEERIIFEGDDIDKTIFIVNGKKMTKKELEKMDKKEIKTIKFESNSDKVPISNTTSNIINKTNSGKLLFKGINYFYKIKNNKSYFYDRYGDDVDNRTSKKLLNFLKKKLK